MDNLVEIAKGVPIPVDIFTSGRGNFYLATVAQDGEYQCVVAFVRRPAGQPPSNYERSRVRTILEAAADGDIILDEIEGMYTSMNGSEHVESVELHLLPVLLGEGPVQIVQEYMSAAVAQSGRSVEFMVRPGGSGIQ